MNCELFRTQSDASVLLELDSLAEQDARITLSEDAFVGEDDKAYMYYLLSVPFILLQIRTSLWIQSDLILNCRRYCQR